MLQVSGLIKIVCVDLFSSLLYDFIFHPLGDL